MSDDYMQNYGLYRAEVEFEPENVADDEKPNKDFVIPSELEIRMAEAEGFKEFYGATGVGFIAGTVGLPGTMEQLYSGAAEVVSQPQQNLLYLFGQFAQQHGHEEVGKAIQTLTGSPQNLSALEAFAQGLAEETIFPSYDDVKEWLASKGLAFDNEAGELIGDLLSLNIIPGLASVAKKTSKKIMDKSKSFETQLKESGLPSTQEVLETYAGGGVTKNIGKAGIGKVKAIVNKLKKGQPIKDHQFRKEIEKNTQNAWSDLRTDKEFMKQYRIINNNKTLSREDKIEKLTQWVNKHINEYPE